MLPSTSSDDRIGNNPGNGSISIELPCAICGVQSTGIHFGVDTCSACAAFFRRTVVLGRQYSCRIEGRCQITRSRPLAQKCIACRFAKCIRVGMNKNAVQLGRDAIGRYSAAVKREVMTPETDRISIVPIPVVLSPTTSTKKSSLLDFPYLNNLVKAQHQVNKWRRLFYKNNGCFGLFDEGELDIKEFNNFDNCMHDLWNIEPRIASGFMNALDFLSFFDKMEKAKLHRHFFIVRQAIEEPYLTWKFGGLHKNWWIMPNRVYIDIANAEKYFEAGIMQNLKMNYREAKKLFEESFKNAMENVGAGMRDNQIGEIEICALFGIALLDQSVSSLSSVSKTKIWQLRNILINEIYRYYRTGLLETSNAELRMGNLLLLLSAIKVHSVTTSENMHLLKTFRLISHDSVYSDICHGNACSELTGI